MKGSGTLLRCDYSFIGYAILDRWKDYYYNHKQEALTWTEQYSTIDK